MTDSDLSTKLVEKENQIKKLALMVKSDREKISQLTDIKNKQEEEIKQYIEKIKNLERKTDDVYKNVTTGNISDINEIKCQFEKEKLILNELLKTLKNNIDEKNDSLQESRKEINDLRLLMEEERKKNEMFLNINLSKFDSKSIEVQFYKISTENSTLRSKLANAEERIEKILEQNEKMKTERHELERTNKHNYDLLSHELSVKNNSYKVILKDYQGATKSLQVTLDDLGKARYFNKKYEEDISALERKVKTIEKELIELKAENEGMRLRMRGNESELENTKRKLKEYENKFNEIRLGKQVFDVTYYYLNSLPLVGKLIMVKEGEAFFFIVENKSSSKKVSFLDVDIRRDIKDSHKIYIKYIKDNSEEEYYSNEINKIFESFDDFRKKSIELSTEIEMRNKKESKENERKVNAKLKDIFKI
jgi:hypothetical protein